MAQKVVTHFIDDLDGSTADETVAFAIDGKSYEIDLSGANAGKLREVLAEYVAAARTVGGKPGRTGAGQSMSTTYEERQEGRRARRWAIDAGMKVSERGRVPAEVLKAYRDHLAEEAARDEAPEDSEKANQEDAAPAELDTSNTAVLAWWTGVLKKQAPKGNRVTPSMRAQYRKAYAGSDVA